MRGWPLFYGVVFACLSHGAGGYAVFGRRGDVLSLARPPVFGFWLWSPLPFCRRPSWACGSPRVLPLRMAASVLQKTILGLRIPSGAAPPDGSPPPTREPNVTETIQMAVIWRVARQAVGLEDMDPMLPGVTSSSAVAAAAPAPPVSGTPPVVAPAVTAGAGQSPLKKVKLSNVIDQTDDTEITVKTRAEMGIYYENHREITGSDPLPEVEPTDLQVAALEDKVVVRDESPYADFSILTPFGRRIQRVMKTKSYAFQPDGTWRAADIPGPPNFQAWQACFRVFSVRHTLLGILKGNLAELQPLARGEPFLGFSKETAEEAAKAMAAVLGVVHRAPTPLRVDLLDALLSASSDPERDVQDWLREGFPLGIEKELKVNTVFPVTEEDTKAVELSRQFPLLTDWAEVDPAENYKSFQEAGDDALEELERVATAGYATKCQSWAEVVQSTGEARPSPSWGASRNRSLVEE
eukprot:s6101_g1.t1